MYVAVVEGVVVVSVTVGRHCKPLPSVHHNWQKRKKKSVTLTGNHFQTRPSQATHTHTHLVVRNAALAPRVGAVARPRRVERLSRPINLVITLRLTEWDTGDVRLIHMGSRLLPPTAHQLQITNSLLTTHTHTHTHTHIHTPTHNNLNTNK